MSHVTVKAGLQAHMDSVPDTPKSKTIQTTLLPTNTHSRQVINDVSTHTSVITQTMNEYGSFKDSRRSPIHRWFEYPAGYSYKLVDAMIHKYGLAPDSLIVDPFLGSGTTTLAASSVGIKSIGVEAHKFVAWVAKTKCTKWNAKQLLQEYEQLLDTITTKQKTNKVDYPALIYKCFTEDALNTLTNIKYSIENMKPKPKNFFKLALVATLRNASIAGTGWPYIAPTEHGRKSARPDALIEFKKRCQLMLGDIQQTTLKTPAKIITGDSRRLSRYVDEDVDLVVTSPPYLNNYDYADRTRFETYFLRIYNDWGDITRGVRDHLMTAATTQVTVSRDTEKATMPTVRELSISIHKEISKLIGHMSSMKENKPGKKRYDLMTGGYFEDLSKTLIEMNDVIGPGGHAVIVLGDSAPYGVHVQTDVLIGRIAKAAGFKSYKINVLRERGGKWRANPQRHHVELRESITTLSK